MFNCKPTDDAGDSGDSGDAGDSGDSGDGGFVNINGDNWTLATSEPAWDDRFGFGLVNYQDKMWVIGGRTLATGVSDVYNSTDGVTWSMVTSDAGWIGRSSHACVVHDGKIWIYGGYRYDGGTNFYNDVWNTTDGTSWTEINSSAQWAERDNFGYTVYDGKMWIAGGRNDIPADQKLVVLKSLVISFPNYIQL